VAEQLFQGLILSCLKCLAVFPALLALLLVERSNPLVGRWQVWLLALALAGLWRRGCCAVLCIVVSGGSLCPLLFFSQIFKGCGSQRTVVVVAVAVAVFDIGVDLDRKLCVRLVFLANLL
jgi:hypothetical protein